MRKFSAGLVFLCCLLSSQVASADVVISGPFQDLKIDLPQSNEKIVWTRDTEYPTLFPPGWKKDKITITISGFGALSGDQLVHIKGLAYESYDNPDFTGNVTITTLYGIDLVPTGTGLEMTGFAAGSPGTVSFSDERFIGSSGTEYLGTSLGTPTLADLPALMPGYDLSPFQGDTNSVVYAFRTIAPVADVLQQVPEPSSLAFAMIVAVGWHGTSRSRTRGKSFA